MHSRLKGSPSLPSLVEFTQRRPTRRKKKDTSMEDDSNCCVCTDRHGGEKKITARQRQKERTRGNILICSMCYCLLRSREHNIDGQGGGAYSILFPVQVSEPPPHCLHFWGLYLHFPAQTYPLPLLLVHSGHWVQHQKRRLQ